MPNTKAGDRRHGKCRNHGRNRNGKSVGAEKILHHHPAAMYAKPITYQHADYSTDRRRSTDSIRNCRGTSVLLAPTAFAMAISTRALGDGHEHDVHDADTADDQRDSGDCYDEHGSPSDTRLISDWPVLRNE